MPALDVSDILDDPDFATSFTVVRTVTTVDSKGRTQVTPTQTPTTGVITSDRGLDLQRDPDARMVTGSILIHTRFALSSGFGATDADIIVWQGREYTVVNVNNYLEFGSGFVSAQAQPRSTT